MHPLRFATLALALSLPSLADAHDAAQPPTLIDSAAAIVDTWATDGDWHLSPARVSPTGGTRFGAMVTADPESDILLQVRSVDPPGAWLDATERWAGGDDQRVLVADLPSHSVSAQVRVLVTPGLIDLAWRLLTPSTEAEQQPEPMDTDIGERSVSQALLDIGVVPRETWGADPTNCSSPEDTWYRFAIHHTAGNRTSGGTVQGAVQGLQGWAMGSGGFCDIPYQFLVGFDGTLWEGRALTLYSGATGGGNNDGNIAISHLGCFDSICNSGGHPAELVMRAGGRLLAQTLATEHGIVTTPTVLMGHRDYPSNATACPGERIHDRLDEYRSTTAHFEGTVTATSWDGEVTLEPDEAIALTVDIRNDGIEAWSSNTKLAPLPRDAGIPLSTDAWLSANRVSDAGDVPPGSTATFTIPLEGAELGTHDLSFGLVEEAVTWFADQPIGGGPVDGAITVRVIVEESEPPTDPPADDDDSAGDDDDSTEPPPAGTPPSGGVRLPEFPEDAGAGCQCKGGNGTNGANAGFLLLFGLGATLRRWRSPARRS